MPREPWRDDPEHLALWRAAREQPDERGPHLVLADWLEEQGQPAASWPERLHGLTGWVARRDPDTGTVWGGLLLMCMSGWRRLLSAPPPEDMLVVLERDVQAYQYLRRCPSRIGWDLRQYDWSSETERAHLLAVPRLELVACKLVGPGGWDWIMDNLPDLLHFEADGPQIDAGRLAGLQRLTRLRALRLFGRAAGDTTALSRLPGLRHLSIGPYYYDADYLASIAPDLESLHADPSDLGDAVRWPRLRSLQMTRGPGEVRLGTREVKTLSQHPMLERLNIRCARVTAAGIEALAALPRLRELVLRFEGGQAPPPLKALARAPALESLTVEGPANEARLLEITSIEGLRSLSLGQAEVSARGLAAVAGMRRLEELRLHGEATDADAVPSLAALPLLEKLDLQSLATPSPITEAVRAVCPPWVEFVTPYFPQYV